MEERRFLNVCKRPLLPLHFMMRWMWHTIKCLIDVGTIFINIKKGGFASWLLRYSHLFNFQEVHLISSRLTITSTTTIIIVVVLEMIWWAKRRMLGYHMWSQERGVGRWVRAKGAAMAFSGLRQLANMKLKDVPSFVRSSANREYVAQKTWGFLNNYNERYIKTSSIRPLNDVLISVFIISYAIGWPTELRHLHHAQEEAKHGKNKKHWHINLHVSCLFLPLLATLHTNTHPSWGCSPIV